MSPGARTIPAAMVLPTAAEMPNHMPSTLRRRRRLRGESASKVLLDAGALGVEDRSDGFGNWGVSGTFGKLGHDDGRGRKSKPEVASWREEFCARYDCACRQGGSVDAEIIGVTNAGTAARSAPEAEAGVDVSVVIPCLNEANSIGICVAKAM